MSTIWVDKYKPRNSNELAGQSRNVSRIKSWLKTYEPSRSRPLFIYGPPGIGKTTAAHLCCKEVGYQTVEFNASDQRNKNIIKEVISSLSNNSRLNFFGRASETKDAIILDEVDGMAGNEDRGGIAQLIQEIKHTKKPMIFICNDGHHQKLRSLKDKCETIEFRKPDYEAIRMVVSKIANREGLRMDKMNVKNLADSSDYDIRQIVNSLSLFRDGNTPDSLVKTTRLSAFEATKKALSIGNLSIDERFDCFFADYNIMPLFMFENYLKNTPVKGDSLKSVSKAIDCMCLSDLADKQIRSNQNWSLLNTQALLSTVIPSKLMSSNIGRVDFPQFLGKLSNMNKRLRLTQELNAHMCLSLRGGLDADYLDVMRERLTGPLIKKSLGGVESVVDFMHDYSLLRDDFNSILELASWQKSPDPMSKIDTKTKVAFTTAYKKRAITLPYFSEEKVTKKRPTSYGVDSYADEAEDVEDEEEEEVMKPKRVVRNEKPKKQPKEKPSKEKPLAKEKPTAKEKAPLEQAGENGKAVKTKDKGASSSNGSSNGSAASKADKRPPDGGIARFFVTKKQKSS